MYQDVCDSAQQVSQLIINKMKPLGSVYTVKIRPAFSIPHLQYFRIKTFDSIKRIAKFLTQGCLHINIMKNDIVSISSLLMEIKFGG